MYYIEGGKEFFVWRMVAAKLVGDVWILQKGKCNSWVNLWASMRQDLFPEMYVTCKCFLSFCENLKISLKC